VSSLESPERGDAGRRGGNRIESSQSTIVTVCSTLGSRGGDDGSSFRECFETVGCCSVRGKRHVNAVFTRFYPVCTHAALVPLFIPPRIGGVLCYQHYARPRMRWMLLFSVVHPSPARDVDRQILRTLQGPHLREWFLESSRDLTPHFGSRVFRREGVLSREHCHQLSLIRRRQSPHRVAARWDGARSTAFASKLRRNHFTAISPARSSRFVEDFCGSGPRITTWFAPESQCREASPPDLEHTFRGFLLGAVGADYSEVPLL
jgi:hypothetical protein